MKHIGDTYLSPAGRIRRVEYLIRTLVLFGVNILAMLLNGILTYLIGSPDLSLIIMIIVALLMTFASLMIIIKRIHDINYNGWYALLLLIPLLGFIWYIALFFIPGTQGKNNFGEPNNG